MKLRFSVFFEFSIYNVPDYRATRICVCFNFNVTLNIMWWLRFVCCSILNVRLKYELMKINNSLKEKIEPRPIQLLSHGSLMSGIN